MEKENACGILSTKMEVMQASRKVDTTAISTLETVVEECKGKEKFWVSRKEISPSTAFVLYHASRNTRLIFEKMRNRFAQASELQANPKVVDDASTVFPELYEMYSLLKSLEKIEVKSEMLEYIRRRVRNLRNTAQKVSMLPTTEEEIESVDKNELARELADLANDLRANLL